jgi:hypothetical protein
VLESLPGARNTDPSKDKDRLQKSDFITTCVLQFMIIVHDISLLHDR